MYRMRTLAALLLSLSLSTVACSGGNFFDSVNDAVNTNPFDIDVVVYNDTSEAVCQVYVAESTLGICHLGATFLAAKRGGQGPPLNIVTLKRT